MCIRKNAFTLIELLVVISIIAVLMSIMMPALSRARESSRNIVCKNHLKQLMTGQLLYANDNKFFAYPTAGGNAPIRGVHPYLGTESLWDPSAAELGEQVNKAPYLCPTIKPSIKSTPAGQKALITDGNMFPYGWNFFLGGYYYNQPQAPAYPLRKLASIKRPGEIFGWADTCFAFTGDREAGNTGYFSGPGSFGWLTSINSASSTYDIIVMRHGSQGKKKVLASSRDITSGDTSAFRTSNAAFLDTHTETIDVTDATNPAKYYVGDAKHNN